MSTSFRVLIEAALESMEQGRFQDFCLEFLPLYDQKYEGLARIGHTAGGKTRTGTPDLIITHSDGSQTAVECSTDQDYWASATDPANSKPIADAERCLKKLSKPREIILVSNREVPPSRPNAKAEVIEHFRTRGQFLVTIFSGDQLSQFIIITLHEPSTRRLVKEFIHELSGAIESSEEAQKFRLASDISSELPVDAKTLLDHISAGIQQCSTTEAARSYVIQKLEESLQFYRLRPIPQFSGVERSTVEELPLRTPLGKVWCLLGVPKIGKSCLITQLATHWSEWDIHWYDCPIEDESCSKSICIDLLRTLLNLSNTAQLLNSSRELANTLSCWQELSTPVVFVIDNAHFLGDSGCKRLAQLLLQLKPYAAFKKFAFVLVSNCALPAFGPVADETVSAPAWSKAELVDFLAQFDLLLDPLTKDTYLDVLFTLSGGHPLLAKALASKYHTAQELLLNQLKQIPSLADETLAAEVEYVLYSDILTDADSQNFVQRLSVVFDGAKEDILDVLRREIEPQIDTPTSTLVKRLRGAVLEGTPSSGYSVSFVFQRLASERITASEREQVCKRVARHLLWSKGRANAGDAIRGIIYSILACDFSFAFLWSTVFLSWASTSDLAPDDLNLILSRLWILKALLIPPEPQLQFEYASVQVLLALTYSKAGQRLEAAEILEKIVIPEPRALEDPMMGGAIASIRVFVGTLRSQLAALMSSDRALALLFEIKIEDLHQASGARIAFLELLVNLIPAFPFSNLPVPYIRNVFSLFGDYSKEERDQTYRIALSIANRAKKENLTETALNPFFGSESSDLLLLNATIGSLLLEQGRTSDALPRIQTALELAKRLDLANGYIGGRLNLLAGDACYQIKDLASAVQFYQETANADMGESFERAWAHWRLGLLQNNPEALHHAVQFFGQEKIYSVMWARAMGAQGAALILAGRVAEGLSCYHTLVETYYKKKDETVGAPAAVAQSYIVRLRAALEGNPLGEIEAGRPDPDPRFFEIVAEDAPPRRAPIYVYYNLSRAYGLLGDPVLSNTCLDEALSFTPESQPDIGIFPLAVAAKIKTIGSKADDHALLVRCFSVIIRQTVTDEIRPDLLLLFILAKADQDIFKNDLNRYCFILDAFEEVIATAAPNDPRWNAELMIRQARVLGRQNVGATQIAQFYTSALYRAKESKQGAIVVEAGHYLGFDKLISDALKAKAEYQLAVIEGIELGGADYGQLLLHGRNLVRFWSAISIWRLNFSDLETKKYLFDTCNELSAAGIPEDESAIIMLLLLMLLFNHYGPAMEWAKVRLPANRSHLPLEVLALLRPVL